MSNIVVAKYKKNEKISESSEARDIVHTDEHTFCHFRNGISREFVTKYGRWIEARDIDDQGVVGLSKETMQYINSQFVAI